jgi:hypothetical protein
VKKVLPAFLVGFLLSATPAVALVINEFVANASPSATEWVEFYNPENSADYIKTYWLDDDTQFASESGQAKRLLTNLNTDNVHYPYFEMQNFLNNPGDFVVLFDAAGIIIDQYQYTSDPGAGVSIGRDPDQTGSFKILNTTSKGAPNPGSVTPTQEPTPTVEPTIEPTVEPTIEPTIEPTVEPTAEPTAEPTGTIIPTLTETPEPTITPLPTILPYPHPYPHPFRNWKCQIVYKNIKIMWMSFRLPKLVCEKT